MKKLVIFGLGDMASMAYLYFSEDPRYEITAFSISKAFMTSEQKTFYDLPIAPFEDIQNSHPSKEYDMFIAMALIDKEL